VLKFGQNHNVESSKAFDLLSYVYDFIFATILESVASYS